MIKIYYLYKGGISGKWYEDYRIFKDRYKALRFLYATVDKYVITGWECKREEDHEFLNYKFRPELKR